MNRQEIQFFLRPPVAKKQTLERALDHTIALLQSYRARYDHWAISYSGGKDSTTLLCLVDFLIRTGTIEAPRSLCVFYADTRLEIPPLYQSAMSILQVIGDHGHQVCVTLPSLDHRFFVYRLGYGVPNPKNHFRWCTPKMKVAPILHALEGIAVELGMGCWKWDERYQKQRYQSYGQWVQRWNEAKQKYERVFEPEQTFLMLTGVRFGESAVRDQRLEQARQEDCQISLACNKDAGECGQARFLLQTPGAIAQTEAPLLHWRVCNIWEYLTFHAPRAGYPTELIAHIYGGEEAQEINARTGCIKCPLVQQDHMLANVLALPEYQYLAPLQQLGSLYEELSQPTNRVRKDGTQRKKDGSFPRNAMRMGPLTLEARRYGLARVLAIQSEINEAAHRLGRPCIDLINEEERLRILELIEANAWPQGWFGDEVRADRVYHQVVNEELTQRSWLEDGAGGSEVFA